MISQMIFAGRGLITPTIAVGGLAFSDSDTQTYPGNGTYYTKSDDSYTIPNNWKTKQWTYKATITSEASYVALGYSIVLYLNGVQIASWSQPASQDSYFRYNSGTRTHTHTLALEAGDTIRGVVKMIGRNVGGSTPTSTNYHELKRIT